MHGGEDDDVQHLKQKLHDNFKKGGMLDSLKVPRAFRVLILCLGTTSFQSP
jgi:hypothetical protein